MEDIKKWSEEKIKAVIYDQLILQKQTSVNIEFLNKELESRVNKVKEIKNKEINKSEQNEK